MDYHKGLHPFCLHVGWAEEEEEEEELVLLSQGGRGGRRGEVEEGAREAGTLSVVLQKS